MINRTALTLGAKPLWNLVSRPSWIDSPPPFRQIRTLRTSLSWLHLCLQPRNDLWFTSVKSNISNRLRNWCTFIRLSFSSSSSSSFVHFYLRFDWIGIQSPRIRFFLCFDLNLLRRSRVHEFNRYVWFEWMWLQDRTKDFLYHLGRVSFYFFVDNLLGRMQMDCFVVAH